MVRTQVYLNEKEYEVLRQEAFQRRRSVSSLLRQLIDEQFIARPKKKAFGIRNIIGVFRDKASDVAMSHDDYLAGVKQ